MSGKVKALIAFTEAYRQYASVDGKPNPAATTQQMLQNLFKNWSDVLEVLTQAMWKAETDYNKGDVVWSPAMIGNIVAVCVKAGKSGASEPSWPERVGGTAPDNTAKWEIMPHVGICTANEDTGIIEVVGSNGAKQSINVITPKKAAFVSTVTINNDGKPAENANDDSVPTTEWVQALIALKANATLPPAPVLNRRIEKSGSTVKLYWREPDDITADGSKIAGWTKTVVVKKQGAYPENPADGTVVLTNTVRDKYSQSPYTDTQVNAANWYYRAFPCNQGTYSKEESNKFGWYSYAYYIDEDDPVESTCVHPVAGYENYHLTPAHMDFVDDKFFWGGWENAQILPRPCMLKTDGTVDYYLDQDDYTKKENGAASDVTNTSYDGNAMMEFACIYSKVEHVGSKLYIYIASHKLDSGYECYPCLRSDGTYNEHFYLPIYEGYVLNKKMRSLSSNTAPSAGDNAENEATYAAANGAGWYTTTWADENLMQMLGVLLFGRLNIQIALGYNCGSSSGGLTHKCGSGNAKGMFYGKESTGPTATKYFGMENWYGHRWRRCNGLMLVDYKYKVKLTRHNQDGSTTNEYNRTGGGYIDTGLTCPSANSSYLKQVYGSKYGAFLPKVVTGASDKTYYCDGVWSSGGTTQLLCGGSVVNGALGGLFACVLNYAPSVGNWSYGASLSYHKP